MKLKLTTAQKTEYKQYLPYFQNGIFRKNDPKKYMDYYLYEIANGVYTDRPDIDQIITQLFYVRDQIHEVYDNQKFFLLLCESFMIFHPDSVDRITSLMRVKGIQIYQGINQSVAQGDYSSIDSYVKAHAKGLKEKERFGEEAYIIHSWRALEEVCYNLEDTYRDFKSEKYTEIYGVEGFRRILTGGKWKKTSFSALEMASFGDRPSKKLMIGDSCEMNQESTKNDFYRYSKKTYELFSSTAILLYLIFQYTESFMIEFLKQGTKRKRSSKSIAGKSISRCTKDEKEVLQLMKEYMADARFDKGIEKGVRTYLSMHKEILPKNPDKKKTASLKDEMEVLDQGKKPEIRRVQVDKLSEVKSEADHVLSLLHLEEISYKDEEGNKEERPREKLENKETVAYFDDLQKGYLNLVLDKRYQEIKGYLTEHNTTEALLIKNINETALLIWEDILLEKDGESVHIIEDYEDELRNMLTV